MSFFRKLFHRKRGQPESEHQRVSSSSEIRTADLFTRPNAPMDRQPPRLRRTPRGRQVNESSPHNTVKAAALPDVLASGPLPDPDQRLAGVPPPEHGLKRTLSAMVKAREIAEDDALAVLSERMDPLVARFYYNARLSPISQLPDEILLIIFKALRDDPVTYFLLRRVSRRFRRVLLGREFHHFLYPMDRPNPDGTGPDLSVYWSDTNRKIIARRLRNDRSCFPCREDAAAAKAQAAAAAAATGNRAGNKKKQFHCSGCNLDHNWRLFSAAERERSWRLRECVGRRGYLSLCAHVKITWEAVSSRYYQLHHRAALLSFETVLAQCKHPSHETRCPDCRRVAADAGPVQKNWPTAYLCLQSPSGELDLRLSWQAETGPLQRLRAFPSRGLRASDVRTAVAELRENAAKYIMPASRPGEVPEMLAFAPTRCSCLDYSGPASFPGGAATQTTATTAAAEVDAEDEATDALFTTGRILNVPPSAQRDAFRYQGHVAWHQHSIGTGFAARTCSKSSNAGQTCRFRFSWQRKIALGRVPPVQRSHIPGPTWYQALDPASLPWCREGGGGGCSRAGGSQPSTDTMCQPAWFWDRDFWRSLHGANPSWR